MNLTVSDVEAPMSAFRKILQSGLIRFRLQKYPSSDPKDGG